MKRFLIILPLALLLAGCGEKSTGKAYILDENKQVVVNTSIQELSVYTDSFRAEGNIRVIVKWRDENGIECVTDFKPGWVLVTVDGRALAKADEARKSK